MALCRKVLLLKVFNTMDKRAYGLLIYKVRLHFLGRLCAEITKGLIRKVN